MIRWHTVLESGLKSYIISSLSKKWKEFSFVKVASDLFINQTLKYYLSAWPWGLLLASDKMTKYWKHIKIPSSSRLRDVTPSHFTSLYVTPLEVRTLEVLISGHYTFGKLHLWVVSPSKYHTLEVTPSDVSPLGHYTFGTFQLRKIRPSTVSEYIQRWKVQRWNFRKCNCPKLKHPEGETSRRCQKVKYPKV